MKLKEFIEQLNKIEDKEAEVMVADSEWGTESLSSIEYKEDYRQPWDDRGNRLPRKSAVVLQ